MAIVFICDDCKRETDCILEVRTQDGTKGVCTTCDLKYQKKGM